jgi:hypothetical protein
MLLKNRQKPRKKQHQMPKPQKRQQKSKKRKLRIKQTMIKRLPRPKPTLSRLS